MRNFFIFICFAFIFPFPAMTISSCDERVTITKFQKTFKLLINRNEYLLNIETLQNSLILKAKSKLNPLIEWTNSSTKEELVENSVLFNPFESLIEIAEFIENTINKNEYSLEQTNEDLKLIIYFTLYKKQITFLLSHNELKILKL